MQSSDHSVVLPLHRLGRAALILAAATASGIPAAPAFAQQSETRLTLEEVVVTARRREESLQEVPISITIFNQQQLDNRNIVSGTDLAVYTPSLSSNNRFGPDQASFAIRGFTQEMRTTASVGVYFADVVAPRGGTNVTSGDGAGPGAFFDLANVQVLKGPQGTLFGRNTTGGAVLLVPHRPADAFEGYLEASAGGYDMSRLQGVVNLPLSERARLRLGIDSMERDGYLRNRSGIGPSRFADVDYISGRASLVLDITDKLENYTVLTYSESENNGSANSYFVCNPAAGGLNDLCRAQQAQVPFDHYAIQSNLADPKTLIRQWQAINTTTWQVSDSFTIKNILSYADFHHVQRSAMYGINWPLPIGRGDFLFTEVNSLGGLPTSSQATLVEELQFSGLAFGERLNWQAGAYYERSTPDDTSGTVSANRLECEHPYSGLDTYRCQDVLRGLAILGSGGAVDPGPSGAITQNVGETDYRNRALYAQATYDLAAKFRLTGGVRYTWDETRGDARQYKIQGFPGLAAGPAAQILCENPELTPADGCRTRGKQESSAPTWLVGLDYIHSDDLMLYGKYARGYRQGNYNYMNPFGFQSVDEEQVDSYELGMKASFSGRVAGYLNVALFYNDFEDQQLQVGFYDTRGLATPTAGPVNAGKSTIQGVEIEARLMATDRLSFDFGYAWLDTELEELVLPTLAADSAYNVLVLPTVEGSQLSLTPEHKLFLTATYLLPLPESVGDVAISATYTYTDEMIASTGSPYGTLPDYELVNFNLNWSRVFGSPFDAALFVTNAFDEEYRTYVPGNFGSMGGEFNNVGEPRMWGARLRYNF